MNENLKPAPTPQPTDPPEEHLRVAFEHGHEGIVIAQDGVIQVANPATSTITGYSPAELIGKSFLDFFHPDDHDQAVAIYQRRLSGDGDERGMTARILNAAGESVWLDFHSLPVEWQERPAVLAFLGDVSDRERARSEASEVSNLFRRIAEVAPCFLFVYDYDLARDVYINRSVPRELGYSEAEAEALGPYPFLKLCHPDDLEPALERESRWHGAVEGTSDAVEFRMRHRNGEWRWFRSYNAPFQVESDGRVKQMLGLCEDVTSSKQGEESLRRNERLESLGLLAGGIAHDFSNLLTPIVGYAELLREHLGEDSPHLDRVRAIETAAQRATELARQLLVFAGRGEIECREIDLNALCEEVVHLYGSLVRASSPAPQVELRLAPRLPPISGDSSQLRQVILNLLTNAHDAVSADAAESSESTAAPGRVAISTGRVELAEGDLEKLLLREGLAAGPVIELRVEDEGVGMSDAELTRLGEPFFTTKPRGRGLGLPASLGILRAHRAGIEIDSQPGRGTRFRIYFSESPASD